MQCLKTFREKNLIKNIEAFNDEEHRLLLICHFIIDTFESLKHNLISIKLN